MSDYLVRVLAKDAGVRGLACISTETAREAIRRHESGGVASLALARAITGGALIGALLKVKQRVALKIQGDGPLRKIIVESDAYGRLRGYVQQPGLDLPLSGDHDLSEAIGAGTLKVVKDVLLKDLIESTVGLVNGSIDDDITRYLNESEQVPSTVEIGARLDDAGDLALAGGLLLQALPGRDDDETLANLLERIEEMPPVDALLASGQTPEQILDALFEGVPYITLEQRPLRFECTCSRERSEKALISLGATELNEILEREDGTVVTCHFCHEKYAFDRTELEAIITRLEGDA